MTTDPRRAEAEKITGSPAEQDEGKAGGVESYAEQMLKKICHDEQVEVWADEMQWDIGLHIVSASDYEHTLAIHESLKEAVVSLAQKVIEETLYHEGRIVKPWVGPASDAPSPQEGE